MNGKQIITTLVLSVGLAGSAAAFDTEGSIEDRLLASFGAGTTAMRSPDRVRHAFVTEGDIHDRLFADHFAVAAGSDRDDGAGYAFTTEGDLVGGAL
ncbi:MAG: hypothetical protein KDH15_08010 [Rhodocyclaceae bacterium]|nr:hypothetical protein [Rhodocyclaceae bacterium]